MSQLKEFTLFSKLPTELRLAVWRCYALPKGPLVHVISSEDRRLTGRIDTNIDAAHDELMWTTRVVLRVNQEARHEVSQGRQLVRLVQTAKALGYHSGSWLKTLHNPDWPQLGYFVGQDRWNQEPLFVNWDLDLFYFRNVRMYTHYYHEDALQRIKLMALEVIRSNIGHEEVAGGSTIFDNFRDGASQSVFDLETATP
ncbi:Uu.00g085970.m01.CDS01 [Anthostomella pinea]|uniref:Uu.00g085970.m01.CDS01 n=1 Tax=Anthostomella pinea TaxID=933095 RepID=A0AAI8YJQ8_9PEZI|nr:Uu.00g085970.m01.CDS01 [Anthostomella pinea]